MKRFSIKTLVWVFIAVATLTPVAIVAVSSFSQSDAVIIAGKQ